MDKLDKKIEELSEKVHEEDLAIVKIEGRLDVDEHKIGIIENELKRLDNNQKQIREWTIGRDIADPMESINIENRIVDKLGKKIDESAEKTMKNSNENHALLEKKIDSQSSRIDNLEIEMLEIREKVVSFENREKERVYGFWSDLKTGIRGKIIAILVGTIVAIGLAMFVMAFGQYLRELIR